MSTFKTEWKATPYALLQEPYNLKAPVVMLYAFILDEYEHWSKKDSYTPSIKTLSKLMNCEERQLRRYLETLEDMGFLERKQQYNKCSVFIVHHFEKTMVKNVHSHSDKNVQIGPDKNVHLSNLSSSNLSSSNLCLKEEKVDEVIEETVNVTMHNDTPSSASNSASNEASEPTACEASIHNLQHCINLAVAKCNELGVKADAGNIERNLLRLGYYKVCKGYEVLDTITYEAPF